MSETTKKEPEFHVFTSELSGRIYAGTINKDKTKWLKKSDVTKEALEAVRDHFLDLYNNENTEANSVGYQWTNKEGKVITLSLNIGTQEAITDA